MSSLDLHQLMEDLKKLKNIEEKYNNIKRFYEEKSELIYKKLNEVEENNANALMEIKEQNSKLISEVRLMLKDVNPVLNLLDEPRTRKKVVDYFAEILHWFREHPNDELSVSEIEDKFNLAGGTSTMKIKQMLMDNPEMKYRKDPNHQARTLFGYKRPIELSEVQILKEKISSKPDLVEIGEDTKMPRKSSYMG